MSARVGVFGATGYTGQELVRLLRRHPRARVAFTTGSGAGHLAHEAGLDEAADAYFLALPHGVAASLRLAPARGAPGGGRRRPLRRPAPPHRRELQAVVRPRPRGPAAHRRGGVRPLRGVPGPPPRRAAGVEPRMLRDLGAAAPHPASPRGPRRPRRHRGRRQERRDRRGPDPARGPPLLRGGRELLGLLARARAPPRGRDRGGAGRPRREARRAHLLPAPAAGEAGHPDRALREAEGRRRPSCVARSTPPTTAPRSSTSWTERRRGSPTSWRRTTAASPCTRPPPAAPSSSRPSTTW